MVRALLLLYNFFHSKKWAFVLFLLVCVAVIGLGFSKLQFEENINSVLPREPLVDQVFEKTGLAEKIIIHCWTDSADADLLKATSDSFMAQLSVQFFPSHIEEINDRIEQDVFFELADRYYDRLPVYLKPTDYAQMDSLTSEAGIKRAIDKSYKTLLSPAGAVFKKNILRDPLGITSFPLQRLQRFRMDDNFDIDDGFLISNDKQHLIAFVIPKGEAAETGSNAELVAGIHALAKSFNEQPDYATVEYFGGPVVAADNAKRVKKDIFLTVNLVSVLLFIFLTIYFRRILTVPFLFIPVLMGGGLAIAAFVLIKDTVSAISLGLGAVILGVTIDFSLHIFNHLRNGKSAPEVIKEIGPAILASCFTTATAFLCLQMINSEALNDLGIFAALSVTFGGVFAMLILPQIISTDKKQETANTFSWVSKIASWPFHKKWYILLPLLVLAVVCAFFVKNIDVDSDLGSMNYMSPETMQHEAHLNSVSNIANKAVYVVALGEKQADLEGALQANERAVEQLETLKQKGTVHDFSDFSALLVSEAKQKDRISRWQQYWTSTKRDSVIHWIDKYAIKKGFKPGAFSAFTNLLQKQYGAQAASLEEAGIFNEYIINNDETLALINIVKTDPDKTAELAAAFDNDEQLKTIDRSAVTNQLIELIEAEFQNLAWISLLVILLILLFYFGRPELVLFTALPVVLSWVITFGLMAIFHIRLNIFNIIVSTFIFGLGIDYAIFTMSGLMRDYKLGTNELPTYKTSILLSFITTLLGTGVLIFAQHPALRSIAVSAIIGMTSVTVLTFTLLPFLFHFYITRRAAKRQRPMTWQIFLKSISTLIPLFSGILILNIVGLIMTALFFIPQKTWKPFFHRLINLWGKFYTAWVFPGKRFRFFNESGEDFEKPCIVMCNHQSLLDTPMVFGLHQNMVMITKDWVYNSVLFGLIARIANFYSIEDDFEEKTELLRQKFNQGYSLVMFPEGTRSLTQKTGRFYRGTFLLAEQLEADIVPVVFLGTGIFLRKDEVAANPQDVSMTVLPRIPYEDKKWGENYRERFKNIRNYYKAEHTKTREKMESPAFFRHNLQSNFTYKGFLLETRLWWLFRMENGYKWLLPYLRNKQHILHLGCRHGMLTQLINMTYENASITAVEADDEMRQLAQNCYVTRENMTFLSEADSYGADAVILDHSFAANESAIGELLDQLPENGLLIVRSGNKDYLQRNGVLKNLVVKNSHLNDINLAGIKELVATKYKRCTATFVTIDKPLKEDLLLIERSATQE